MLCVTVYEVETGDETRVRVPALPQQGHRLAWRKAGKGIAPGTSLQCVGKVVDVVVFAASDATDDDELPRAPVVYVAVSDRGRRLPQGAT